MAQGLVLTATSAELPGICPVWKAWLIFLKLKFINKFKFSSVYSVSMGDKQFLSSKPE